jgi:hypothetical protein
MACCQPALLQSGLQCCSESVQTAGARYAKSIMGAWKWGAPGGRAAWPTYFRGAGWQSVAIEAWADLATQMGFQPEGSDEGRGRGRGSGAAAVSPAGASAHAADRAGQGSPGDKSSRGRAVVSGEGVEATVKSGSGTVAAALGADDAAATSSRVAYEDMPAHDRFGLMLAVPV